MSETPQITSPAMERFETIVNFAVGNFAKANNIEAPTEDLRAELFKAADQLLEDAAMEMADTTVNGICYVLLQIYRNGQSPGKTSNPMMNELQEILVAAGKRAQHDDHSAQDSY